MARTEPESVETLSDFLKWTSQFTDGTYVFRGVPNNKYEIQASAYRRMPESDRNSEDKGFQTFVEINEALIREARLRGYDQKDGRPLNDLEILADLQHFGAATCLIDFTYSAQIALWFACGQDSKTQCPTDGKVFAVHKDVDRFIEIEPDLLTEPLPYLLNSNEPQLYHWQPRQQNTRILAQQSIFFFGHYEFSEHAACIIQTHKKEEFRTELERVSGITEMRLFPDFEGFSRLRDDRTPYTPLSADEHAKHADRAIQRDKFEEAIAAYDKAIYRKPGDASLYYSRGFAKGRQEKYEDAITDYNEAIQLNPDDASIYYQRGFAKAQLGQYENAIADYNEAIRLNPNNAFIYRERGVMKARLGRYEEAEEDRQQSEELVQPG